MYLVHLLYLFICNSMCVIPMFTHTHIGVYVHKYVYIYIIYGCIHMVRSKGSWRISSDIRKDPGGDREMGCRILKDMRDDAEGYLRLSDYHEGWHTRGSWKISQKEILGYARWSWILIKHILKGPSRHPRSSVRVWGARKLPEDIVKEADGYPRLSRRISRISSHILEDPVHLDGCSGILLRIIVWISLRIPTDILRCPVGSRRTFSNALENPEGCAQIFYSILEDIIT